MSTRTEADEGQAKASRPSVTAPKHLNLEDEARVWYGDNYDYVTASNQHAIRMLAAFASHVLALTPAQGVTVDQIMSALMEVAGKRWSFTERQRIKTRLSALLTK